MNELKPCPFCGGEAKFVHIFENPEKCMVSCRECDGGIDAVFANEDDAATAWNRRAQPDITGETSDGYHTFNELYHHRAVLFSAICNSRPDIAWRAKRHHDGTMYNGMFIVGINTPDGQATYHYDVEPYWEMFRVPELLQAPEWDGHTPAQAIERIWKLSTQPAEAADKRAKELEAAQRWISVKERLPEAEKKVLIRMSGKTFGHAYTTIAAHIGYHDAKAEDDWQEYEGETEYDEENDCFWVHPCWYEVNMVDDNPNYELDDDYEVTHWMPLPEPPEVKDGHY